MRLTGKWCVSVKITDRHQSSSAHFKQKNAIELYARGRGHFFVTALYERVEEVVSRYRMIKSSFFIVDNVMYFVYFESCNNRLKINQIIKSNS